MYRPALLAEVDLHYVRAGVGIDEWRRVACFSPLGEEVQADPWSDASVWDRAPELAAGPSAGIGFAGLASAAARPASYRPWTSALKGFLYRSRALTVWRCLDPKLVSAPGESESDFLIRLREEMRVARDLAIDRLRDRHAVKLRQAGDRVRRARERVDREKSQYSQQKTQTAISVGASVLDALMGRKTVSRSSLGRATAAARGAGRAARERDDVRRAGEALEESLSRLSELETELEAELEAVRSAYAPESVKLESLAVPPRKSDIVIHRLSLAWAPWRRTGTGDWIPDWKMPRPEAGA